MKVDIRTQPGHPVPQFVIEAETDAERRMMHAFVEYPIRSSDPVRFWMHGATHDESGVSAFHFGYIKERQPLVLRIKAAWAAIINKHPVGRT